MKKWDKEKIKLKNVISIWLFIFVLSALLTIFNVINFHFLNNRSCNDSSGTRPHFDFYCEGRTGYTSLFYIVVIATGMTLIMVFAQSMVNLKNSRFDRNIHPLLVIPLIILLGIILVPIVIALAAFLTTL